MGALDRVFRGRRGGQERPLAAIIAGLWRNGEQGVWYDPSDLSTMFQDAAGMLPVYMPGQGQVDPPVGLLLDKRLGFALGPERITNTGFQTLDGWTAVRGASATVSGGAVTVTTANPQNWGSVSTPIATEPGKTYLVKVLMTSGDGQNVQLLVSESPVNHVNITSTGGARNAVGYYSLVFKAAKTVHYVWLGASTNTAAVSVSSWAAPSVREISANCAYQATTTSRPTLSARYNLLTNTAFSGAAVGVPGTAPTGWSSNFSTASITGVSSLGTDYVIQLTVSAQRLFFAQSFSAASSTTYSLSCLVVENSGIPIEQLLGFTGMPTGATLQWFINGVPVSASAVPLAGSRAELRLVTGATAGTPAGRVGIGCLMNATGVVAVAQPDVRVTNDGVGLPPYQRVVDANTYDTAGFPLYLRFDGVDDFLQTASVDFSGTDVVTMATAYRKLSDAAVGEIFALSGSPTASSGTFGFYTPESANGAAAAVFFARGASSIISGQRLGTAPISCVAGGWVSISMPYMRYRINQGSSLTSSEATGGGNFGNYPLYIGRRSGTSFPFNGRLYSLIIRGTATPDATIAQVERHLNQKARIY